jgi:Cytochrome c7 and related cytochrome c
MKPAAMKRALLIGLGSVVACATVATVVGGEPEADTILFPHERHAKASVDCISCHETIWDATSLAGGGFIPKEEKCMECHKAAKAEGKCAMCHSNVKLAAAWPERKPALNFNHKAHLDRTEPKEDCTKCHTRLAEPGASVPVSDGHKACLQCHEHADQYAGAACNTCHLDLSRYPLRPLTQVSHDGDFLKRHAAAAKSAGQSCNACHEQNFCLDCHAKTNAVPTNIRFIDRPDRRFIHTGDFLGRHAVEAKGDPASCQKCHAPSSCEQCHANEHVAAGLSTARSPHPSGWDLPGAGSSFHGDEARRNIVSCAACHDQGDQSNCVRCHKVGGIGGDPHPTGFARKHNVMDAQKDGRCKACHQ